MHLQVVDATPYKVRTFAGDSQSYGDGPPAFVVHVPDRAYWTTLQDANAYSAAMAFIRGEFRIDGDLLSALRWWHDRRAHDSRQDWIFRLWYRLRPESMFQSARRAHENIRFHYDRSNAFYRQFLDRRLVYSCAYFTAPDLSLDDAQLAKMDHICRKLDLRPGEQLLDIGCGWGALVMHAAARYGVEAVGCTLSEQQHHYAIDAVAVEGLTEHVAIRDCDYRDVTGTFSKIASVGMFEHVGRRRLGEYFSAVARLLKQDGLFLNHGIVRPSTRMVDSQSVFLQHRVFPGGELTSIGEVMREAEHAGFEVLDSENLRPHYALTCSAWVARLQKHRSACLLTVDAHTYRTWLLYLAGAAIAFERGDIEIHQVLLAHRSPRSQRRLTRRYMYGDDHSARVRFTSHGPH